MTMPYKKTVSLFACLLSLTGSYGCQSAQQKVYQQASRSGGEYHSAPYSQMEPGHQRPDQYLNEPAPAPVDNSFPPTAPPSLTLPQPEKHSSYSGSPIRKTSQEEFVEDQEYFKSVFDSEPVEPAQKHLGLVPRYSSVSSSVSEKFSQMNGKVKGLYSKMKSHVKTPEWIRKVSGNYVVVQEAEGFCADMSCIEAAPVFEQFPAQTEPLDDVEPIGPQPVFPQPTQPKPLLPQPELDNKNNLPRLPPPGETTHWDNSWRVSATLEQLPVDNYSTLDDQIEQWPHSKQRMQQNAQAFRLKTATPVSAPKYMQNQAEQKHPIELTVPAMISQEQSAPIRKIGLQNSRNANNPATLGLPSSYSPYTPLPAKAISQKGY